MATCHFPQTPKSYSQQESPLNLGENGGADSHKPTIRGNNTHNYPRLTTAPFLLPQPKISDRGLNQRTKIHFLEKNQQNGWVKALVFHIYPEPQVAQASPSVWGFFSIVPTRGELQTVQQGTAGWKHHLSFAALSVNNRPSLCCWTLWFTAPGSFAYFPVLPCLQPFKWLWGNLLCYKVHSVGKQDETRRPGHWKRLLYNIVVYTMDYLYKWLQLSGDLSRFYPAFVWKQLV